MYVYESENVPLHRHQLQGATKMSLDGGVTFFPYGDIHFEVHGFNMTNNDTNNARAIVYNVQFEQTYLDYMQTPSNICAKGKTSQFSFTILTFTVNVFRSPSDGDLMIPPWTLCDVLVKRLVSFFAKKNKNKFFLNFF